GRINSTTGYHLRWPKKNSTHCPGWVDHYIPENHGVVTARLEAVPPLKRGLIVYSPGSRDSMI
ncbi:hypothetical protein ACRCQM_27820, partial [Pseudomonas aeruginosa]